jgi:hypothetical protein
MCDAFSWGKARRPGQFMKFRQLRNPQVEAAVTEYRLITKTS